LSRSLTSSRHIPGRNGALERGPGDGTVRVTSLTVGGKRSKGEERVDGPEQNRGVKQMGTAGKDY